MLILISIWRISMTGSKLFSYWLFYIFMQNLTNLDNLPVSLESGNFRWTAMWRRSLNWSICYWKGIVLTKCQGPRQEVSSSLWAPKRIPFKSTLLSWPIWLVLFFHFWKSIGPEICQHKSGRFPFVNFPKLVHTKAFSRWNIWNRVWLHFWLFLLFRVTSNWKPILGPGCCGWETAVPKRFTISPRKLSIVRLFGQNSRK